MGISTDCDEGHGLRAPLFLPSDPGPKRVSRHFLTRFDGDYPPVPLESSGCAITPETHVRRSGVCRMWVGSASTINCRGRAVDSRMRCPCARARGEPLPKGSFKKNLAFCGATLTLWQTCHCPRGLDIRDSHQLPSIGTEAPPSGARRRAGICCVAAPRRCRHIACVAAPCICPPGARAKMPTYS